MQEFKFVNSTPGMQCFFKFNKKLNHEIHFYIVRMIFFSPYGRSYHDRADVVTIECADIIFHRADNLIMTAQTLNINYTDI